MAAAAATKEMTLSEPPSDGISSLRFSSSEQSVLASASWDCTVRLYDVSSNVLQGSQKQRAPVLDVAFLEPSKVFGAGLAREIVLHDFGSSSGASAVIGRHDDAVKSLEYSDAHRESPYSILQHKGTKLAV